MKLAGFSQRISGGNSGESDPESVHSLAARLAGINRDGFPIADLPLDPERQAWILRLAAAFRTPSNWPQPPELAGVSSSARVPNDLQPMSGEINRGALVDAARAAFFPPPPPTPAASPRRLTGLRWRGEGRRR